MNRNSPNVQTTTWYQSRGKYSTEGNDVVKEKVTEEQYNILAEGDTIK